MLYAHYLNVGSATFQTSATVTLTPAKPGIVTTHVGNMLLQQMTFTVPAYTTQASPYQATYTMNGASTLPASYAIFSSQGYLATNGLSLTGEHRGPGSSTASRRRGEPGTFLHVAGAPEFFHVDRAGGAPSSYRTRALSRGTAPNTTRRGRRSPASGDSSKANACARYVAQCTTPPTRPTRTWFS